ncbi:hypothetical protein KQ940_16765 [Marinobacterium sp. D7]|uniref:hypothetical protein n=1 Tax=Marinobacterium ramblicola TaxID=2849041 RepID=UPI001C2CC8AE|nr:hypothetical protein [Marinobacterium ramblicola]MBV1789708.1 hypothetical protein [Marinobacterium ramblicola]
MNSTAPFPQTTMDEVPKSILYRQSEAKDEKLIERELIAHISLEARDLEFNEERCFILSSN